MTDRSDNPAANLDSPGTATGPALRRPRWGPEHLFPTVLLLFGLIFAVGLPPLQVPDEHDHFLRAYAISRGRLFFEVHDGTPGCSVPAWAAQLTPRVGADWCSDWHEIREAASRSFGDREPSWIPLPAIASTFFVPYLPQALGVAAARAAGGSALHMIYAGRLANLFFAVLLFHVALRLTPAFKLVFGVVALLPISVQQLASLSPDASIVSAALLFLALTLRYACGPGRRMGDADLSGLAGAAAWLALCKFPYAVLSLFYFAIPRVRAGSWGSYLRKTLLYFGAAGTALAIWAVLTAPAVPKKQPLTDTRLQEQADFVKTHPFRTARVFLESAADYGPLWLQELTTLGPFSAPMNPFFLGGLAILAVVSALVDSPPPGLGLRVKGVACLSAVACLAVLLYSLYVWWSPLGGPRVEGIQGRYLLPILPLLLAPLSNRRIGGAAGTHWPSLVAVFSGAALAGAVVTVVQRYWTTRVILTPPLAPLAAASAVPAIAYVGTLVLSRLRRRATSSPQARAGEMRLPFPPESETRGANSAA